MSREIVAALEEPYQRSWALLAQYLDICPENIWAETNGGWPVWQQAAHAIAVLNFCILETDEQAFLPAPADLLPKTATVTLPLPAGFVRAGARVQVQQDGNAAEVTALNNSLSLY